MEDKELEDKIETYLRKRDAEDYIRKAKSEKHSDHYNFLPNDQVRMWVERRTDWEVCNLKLDDIPKQQLENLVIKEFFDTHTLVANISKYNKKDEYLVGRNCKLYADCKQFTDGWKND